MNTTHQEHISLLLFSGFYHLNDLLSQNLEQKDLTEALLSWLKVKQISKCLELALLVTAIFLS